jgi:hypothetical protein
LVEAFGGVELGAVAGQEVQLDQLGEDVPLTVELRGGGPVIS